MNTNPGKLSADRLRRVRGLGRSPDVLDAPNTDEENELLVGDQCATVLHYETKKSRKLCLAVILIDKFNNKSTCTTNDDTERLITGRAMCLESSDTKLVWTGGKCIKTSIAVNVGNTVPLNPNYNVENSALSFDLDPLVHIFSALRAKSEGNSANVPSVKHVSELPYDEKLATSIEDDFIDDTRTVCHICKRVLLNKNLRLHFGKHMLEKKLPTSACGFCGKVGGACQDNFYIIAVVYLKYSIPPDKLLTRSCSPTDDEESELCHIH